MKAYAPSVALHVAFCALALVFSGCTHTVLTSQSFAHPVPMRTTVDDKPAGTLDDLSLATSALQNGDASLAASLFDKALDKHPRNVDALDGLGAALALSGETERARRAYEKAAALAPDSITPMIGLARIALHERRLDDAISRYEQVLRRDPSNALASAGLGTAFAIKGDERRAQDIFGQALQLHPGDRMLTVDLGLSMVLAGELRKGAHLLLTVAGEPSAPPQARHDLALAYGLLGNDGAADKILTRDLPRASVDDNLTFYKIVRARLDAPLETAPVAMATEKRKIGVRQISLAGASPIELPRSAPASASSSAPFARQALSERPSASRVALNVARDVPRLAPAVVDPLPAPRASSALERGDDSGSDDATPGPQWQFHGQTRLLRSH